MQGPRLERALADGLAARSDEVARRLESGDPCGARAEADAMRNDLIAAINAHRVPEQYLEDLTAAVNEIAEQIPPCAAATPPPPPADDPDEDEDGKGDGKKKENDEGDDDKGKGNDDKGDDRGKGDDD